MIISCCKILQHEGWYPKLRTSWYRGYYLTKWWLTRLLFLFG